MEFKEQIQRILENVPKVYEAGSSSIKNEVSNALKGSASGEIVALKDVSPLEHILGVKVSTPHIADIEAVKVRVLGKNIIPFPYRYGAETLSAGLKYTFYDDGTIGIKGIATAYSCVYLIGNHSSMGTVGELLGNGSTYTLSLSVISQKEGTVTPSAFIKTFNKTTNTEQYINWSQPTFTVNKTNKTYDYLRVFVSGNAEGVEVDCRVGVQLEYNTTATEFEPYKEPVEYTVNPDGTVDGVKSIAPATTLTTDTEGVLIEVEYNKDINKAFAELQQAIISLGGNV